MAVWCSNLTDVSTAFGELFRVSISSPGVQLQLVLNGRMNLMQLEGAFLRFPSILIVRVCVC